MKVAQYDLLLHCQVKVLAQFLHTFLLLLWRGLSTRVGWLRMGLRQRALGLLFRSWNLRPLLLAVAAVSGVECCGEVLLLIPLLLFARTF